MPPQHLSFVSLAGDSLYCSILISSGCDQRLDSAEDDGGVPVESASTQATSSCVMASKGTIISLDRKSVV